MQHNEKMFDFYSPKPKEFVRKCDKPGCHKEGEFRAPKSRNNLKSYYWFCQEHAAEYNKNWDYFRGLTAKEIERLVDSALLGERPTWNLHLASYMKQKIWQKLRDDIGIENDFEYNSAPAQNPKDKALHEAYAVLQLAPNTDWPTVKKRYKELVKKYHPDIQTTLSKDAANEKIKEINVAYSFLKGQN